MAVRSARTGTTSLAGARPAGASDAVITWAGLADLPALARLQRRAFTNHQGYGLITLGLLWAAPRVLLLVARADDTPAGMIIADERRGRTAHGRILNLCVDPGFRRLGIGRDLMRAAEALLPAGRIVLMVDQHNDPAIALYTSLGYRDVGLKPDYYGRGRHALVMQKG